MSRVNRAINIERSVKLAFFSGSILLLFLIITQVQNMLVSLLLAFVTYFLLAPVVDQMEKRGLSRLWATAIPFILLSAIFGVTSYFLISDLSNQVMSLQEQFPKYLSSLNSQISQLETQIGGLTKTVFQTDIQGKIQSQILAWGKVFLEQLPNFLSTSFTVLLLAPFFSFFMLLNGSDFTRNLIAMVPNNIFELVLNLQHQIGSQMGGFIRARLIESIIVGVLIWGGLLALDFPYALILSIFAAILNIIPYIGPIFGAAPAFLISFANNSPSSEMIWLVVIFAVVQVIDTVVLVPFLVAKIVDLHPVTVVLAILIGSQAMGILGMIICIPIVSALKVTANALYRHFTDFRA